MGRGGTAGNTEEVRRSDDRQRVVDISICVADDGTRLDGAKDFLGERSAGTGVQGLDRFDGVGRHETLCPEVRQKISVAASWL